MLKNFRLPSPLAKPNYLCYITMSRWRVRTKRIIMELSPKQQAVNEIKKAESVLILGHRKPDADHLGSMLALSLALDTLGKKTELVVSGKIEANFKFLPGIEKIKDNFRHSEDKILKIDTNKIPIKGMKWQKEDEYLNIFLESEKNLKFEFIEIDNGKPRPDLVIVLNTPDIENIDNIYNKNTELFYEVPIVNIDHHPGNEYFGTINLVDLTATSTAEILVSLIEALGQKIDNEEVATSLLSGIIYSTQSFRNQNTTPKSLTVAAQLLAAGAKQQEIISNFYKKKPVELLRVWGEMLAHINEDRVHRFAWTVVDAADEQNVSKEDIFSAGDDLLTNTPDADIVLILYKGKENPGIVFGKLKGSKNKEVLSLAKLFGGNGTNSDAQFNIKEESLEIAEKIILKKIADSWQDNDEIEKQEVWDVIESKNNSEGVEKNIDQPEVKKENLKVAKEKEDAIEEALKSISQIEKDQDRKEFEHIGEVISRKKGGMRVIEGQKDKEEEIDIFDENED